MVGGSRARRQGATRATGRERQVERPEGNGTLARPPDPSPRQRLLLDRARKSEADGNAIAAVLVYGEVIRIGEGSAARLAKRCVTEIVRRACNQ